MSLNKNNIVIGFLLISNILIGQTFSGLLIDKNQKTPIQFATVFIQSKEFKKGVLTNSSGKFQFESLPIGNYNLTIQSIGFITKTEEIEITENEKNLTIELTSSIENLHEVVVETQSLVGNSNQLIKTPGSVSFISPKQMEQFNYTDINRALRTIPGVYLQEEDGFGLRPNIGLRGTGVERSSKITIMEDGVLMAPGPYSSPAAYFFPTAGRMESIEVMKGSSQISFGPQSTGGAINLVSTQLPAEKKAQINLIGGSFNTRNLHAYYGENFGQVAFLVETFQLSSDGFKTLPNNQNTGFNKQDYVGKLRFNSKATAKIYQSLTLKGSLVYENSNETYLGLTDDDFKASPFSRYSASANDNMDANQSSFSATHFISFSENIEMVTTAYRTNFSRNWYKLDAALDSTGNKVGISSILDNPQSSYLFNVINGSLNSTWGALRMRANNRDYYSEGIQTRLNIEKNFYNLKNKISIGGRIHRDAMDRFQWEDDYDMLNNQLSLVKIGEPGTQSNLIESANAVSAFGEYSAELGSFVLKTGVRMENINYTKKDFGKNDVIRNETNLVTFKNHVNQIIPGASIMYNLNPKNIIFTGVHKGFSPPGSQPNTEAENSINYELGYRYKGILGNLQLVGFYNDYNNLLGADLSVSGGTGTNNLFNAGEALTQGIEFEYANQFFINESWSIPFQTSYAFIHATFKNSFNSSFEPWATVVSGDLMPYIPQHTANVTTGIQNHYFNIIGQMSYTSSINTIASNKQLNNQNAVKGFAVCDLSSEIFVSNQAKIFIGLNNIFKNTYAVARRPFGLRPGMPRSLRLGFKWTLN